MSDDEDHGPSPRFPCKHCFEPADHHAGNKCLFNSYGRYEPVTASEFKAQLYAKNNMVPGYTGAVEFQWPDRGNVYKIRFYGSDSESFSWSLMDEGAHAKKALPR